MTILAGDTAVVTGAAGVRGMGRAIAMRLAAEGANVVVVDHPDAPKGFTPEALAAGWQGLDSVAGHIESLGRGAMAAPCDITDTASVKKVVASVLSRFGKIDILVNNAAISGPVGLPATDIEDVIWDRVLKINLTGTFNISRAVAQSMVAKNEGGKIIMVSSWGAKTGIAGMAAYCAAKAGVLSLTQTMALELAPHKINVNAICPGGFPTDINYPRIAKIAEEKGISIDEARAFHIASFGARSPLGRVGDVEDMANVVTFLASDQSSYITGQSLNVDGGALMAR
jgi:NAD(P)-dependent dehydrogenase (short-subunit alcohol dehydrogenase family)